MQFKNTFSWKKFLIALSKVICFKFGMYSGDFEEHKICKIGKNWSGDFGNMKG